MRRASQTRGASGRSGNVVEADRLADELYRLMAFEPAVRPASMPLLELGEIAEFARRKGMRPHAFEEHFTDRDPPAGELLRLEPIGPFRERAPTEHVRPEVRDVELLDVSFRDDLLEPEQILAPVEVAVEQY